MVFSPFYPICRTRRTSFDNKRRQAAVSLSHTIPGILAGALVDQRRNQISPLTLQQIPHGLLYQTHAFSLGTDPIEYLRVVCLGYGQVKIPLKLPYSRIVVGVYHPRFGSVGDLVTGSHHPCRHDHILVEYGLLREAAHLMIDLSVIRRTYIRTEEGLDPSSSISSCPLIRLSFG